MASFSPKQLRLKVQTARVKREKDPAFYIVPPILVAAVFAFCAYVPRSVLDFKRSSGVRMIAASKIVRVDMPDPNVGLPDYELPEGCVNLLRGAANVKVSAPVEGAPALNAVDGSCADNDVIAAALPADNESAWWQVELPQGKPGQELVIYGGGSQSSAGKFVGGFSVDVQYDNGETATRSFCLEGFALEGYETMTLSESAKVKRIRVTALEGKAPVVLREVMLIGPAD